MSDTVVQLETRAEDRLASEMRRSCGDVSKIPAGALNRSCEFCRSRKRRCDGDSVNPCSRCIVKDGGRNCVYRTRRPKNGRLRQARQPRPAVCSVTTDPDTYMSIVHAATAEGKVAGMHRRSVHTMKRCRWSASPATGLVGMQENSFLGSYFDCVGFLPLTCQSNIRAAMVDIMTTSAHVGTAQLQQSGLIREDWGYSDAAVEERTDSARSSLMSMARNVQSTGTRSEKHEMAQQPGSSIIDVSTCMFWCAVALGALVQGCPPESVSIHIQAATAALERHSGPATADVAKAWTILAYVYGYCGDADTFVEYLRTSAAVLRECGGVELGGCSDSASTGLFELVKQADEAEISLGNSCAIEYAQMFCREEFPAPEIREAATELEVFQFVMRSYRLFVQAWLEDVCQQACTVSSEDEAAAQGLLVYRQKTDVGDDMLVEVSGERDVGPPGLNEQNMLSRISGFSREFERLEDAVERPSIGSGIGGLIINGTLVYAKVSQNDMQGAVERMTRSVGVFVRYPGIIRSVMGTHNAHVLIATLAIMGHRELYEKLRGAYNPMRPAGSLPLPPFDEWKGTGVCCGHVYCRSWERTIQMCQTDYSWSTGSLDDDLHAETTHEPSCFRGDDGERGTSQRIEVFTEEAKVKLRARGDAAPSPTGCCPDMETGGLNRGRRFEDGGIYDEVVSVEKGGTRTVGRGDALATHGAGGPTSSYTIGRQANGTAAPGSSADEVDGTILEMATSGLGQHDGVVTTKPTLATVSAQNHLSKCPTGPPYLSDEVMIVPLSAVEANSTTGFVSAYPVKLGDATAPSVPFESTPEAHYEVTSGDQSPRTGNDVAAFGEGVDIDANGPKSSGCGEICEGGAYAVADFERRSGATLSEVSPVSEDNWEADAEDSVLDVAAADWLDVTHAMLDHTIPFI